MMIAQVMAGYSFGEADILRRAMSKKKEDVLLGERDKFINRSVSLGFSFEKAKQVYDLILKFASYGFNRAHSVSYALISYRIAYLKVHYPLQFMKHLLNSNIGGDVKTRSYVYECKSRGINILKPDINVSGLELLLGIVMFLIGIVITMKIEFKKQYVAMAGRHYTINNDFILLSNNIFYIINNYFINY